MDTFGPKETATKHKLASTHETFSDEGWWMVTLID